MDDTDETDDQTGSHSHRRRDAGADGFGEPFAGVFGGGAGVLRGVGGAVWRSFAT